MKRFQNTVGCSIFLIHSCTPRSSLHDAQAEYILFWNSLYIILKSTASIKTVEKERNLYMQSHYPFHKRMGKASSLQENRFSCFLMPFWKKPCMMQKPFVTPLILIAVSRYHFAGTKLKQPPMMFLHEYRPRVVILRCGRSPGPITKACGRGIIFLSGRTSKNRL